MHLTQFYPKPHQNRHTKLFWLKILKVLCNFRYLTYVGGRLNREGTYLKFWLRGVGFIREGFDRKEGLMELLQYVVSPMSH